jgi:hypothetical protein
MCSVIVTKEILPSFSVKELGDVDWKYALDPGKLYIWQSVEIEDDVLGVLADGEPMRGVQVTNAVLLTTGLLHSIVLPCEYSPLFCCQLRELDKVVAAHECVAVCQLSPEFYPKTKVLYP